MSTITKYFQITNQILLSYEYDNYKTYTDTNDLAEQFSEHNPVIYTSLSGEMSVLDVPKTTDCHNSLFYTRFPDRFNGQYTFPGYLTGSETANILTKTTANACLQNLLTNNYIHRLFTNSLDKSIFFSSDTYGNLTYDHLKVYLICGYILNDCSAINIKIKAARNAEESVKLVNNQPKNVRNGSWAVLANLTIFRDRLKDMIKWVPSPLYMNSKFFDRYIDISFPSIADLSNKVDTTDSTKEFFNILNISKNKDLMIEFSYVYSSNVTTAPESDLFNNYLGLVDTCKFYESNTVEAAIKMDTNSDLFNIRIYEDPDTNEIVYYPIFGEGGTAKDLDTDLMLSIETGTIPMTEKAFIDSADNADDFYETYGTNARKWVIINEVSVTYNYRNMYIQSTDSEDDITETYNERFTRTIDYTDKTSADGEFWRTRYKPIIPERYGKVCSTIVINYVCHLMNRCTGSEVIRTAGMAVKHAAEKYGENPRVLDIANMSKWKIINKIVQNNVATSQNVSTNIVEKIVKVYYDSTNLVVQANGSAETYAQGKATLNLYHDTHNYALKLYNVNNSSVNVPLNLAGPYYYYVSFGLSNGGTLKKTATIDTVNLGVNALTFALSATETKQIMDVSNNYFAVMSGSQVNSQTAENIVYEGNVAWI